MTVAGLCRSCGQYVWLNDQWGCVNGHPWSEISNWYDPANGTPVTPYWLQTAPATPAGAQPAAAPTPEPSLEPEPDPTPIPAPQWAPPSAPAAELTPFAVAPSLAAPSPVPAARNPQTAPSSAPAPSPVPAPTPVPAPATAPAAPAPSDRLTLLGDILATLSQYPGYRSQYGTDTDIVIDNVVADANWGTGKKKVEFSAIMKAAEPELTIYYWEILKESGSGLNFGGFDAEMSTTSGMHRWGTKSETVIGPGGVAMDYDWDYGTTRSIVEGVAARHGWKVKVVLQKKSAQW